MHPKRSSSSTACSSYKVVLSQFAYKFKKKRRQAALRAHFLLSCSTAPLAPVIDTQKTLAYDQLFLCWRLPQDSAAAWHFSVEFQRRAGGAGAVWGGTSSPSSSTPWQRLNEVKGTSAVIDRLQMDSVYVLRVRGCNKAGFGEYSEEVYLHTPPAPGMKAFCSLIAAGTSMLRGACSISRTILNFKSSSFILKSQQK